MGSFTRVGFGRSEGWLALPLLVMLAFGMIEIGRAINQAGAVMKGMRTAGLYAAEDEFPLSAAVLARAENIVRTGDPSGASTYLASGWAKEAARVQVYELSFDLAGSSLPVVRISATVPYDPMLSGLLPVPAFNFELSHDQAFMVD
jgi:hypothetical protein